MSGIERLLLVGGAAAAFGIIMAKKAKKKAPKPVEPLEPAEVHIAQTGSSDGWAWRVRAKTGAAETFYGDILAPGSNLWQPVSLETYNITDKAKEMALRSISYAKELAERPSGKVMEEGVLKKWGWRVRMMGTVEDLDAEYIGEILAPGTTIWTPAHLDRRDNRPDVKLLAEEAINAARSLALTGM